MARHQGSCHCGAVTYTVETELKPLIRCNCSICARSGAILTFASTDQFRLLSGEEVLTDYQFNKHAVHHLFCRVCGIKSFGRGKGPDGREMVAINVGCLEGIDVNTLEPQKFDGKAL